ncbi:MAG: hypothetical protein U1A78_08300 [Polyangia bacterium]
MLAAAPMLCSALLGCVEVPVNDVAPPPGGRDGGTDLGKTDGGTIPTGPAWHFESPLPTSNNLRAVWGVPGRTADQDELYVGGDSGTLMVGGATGWRMEQAFGFDRRVVLGLSGQIVSGAATVLAVGIYDLALQRQAGAWSDLNPVLGTGDGALNAVWASSTPGEFFVAGTTGRLFRVSNRGASWAREGATTTTDSLFGITGTGGGGGVDVYAVGANGRIVHRVGGNWMKEADNLVTQQLNATWLNAANGEVYAVGDGGVVLHKKSNAWAPETPPTSAQLTALWGTATEVWAVGARGTILRRDPSGTWQNEGSPALTGELLSALWGTERDGQATVYAVGNLGTILRRDKGTWQALSQRVTTSSLMSVWARNPSEVYAVGGDGTILQRTGIGAQGRWQQVTGVPTSSSFNAVSGYSSGAGAADVYAVGTEGTIVHRTGANWAIEGATLTSGELTGVWVGADSVYVVGRGGRVFRKGATGWGPVPDPMGGPLTTEFFAVWGSGGGGNEVVFVAGSNGAIWRRQGTTWKQEAPGMTTESFLALVGSSEDGLLAFGNKGLVLRRTAATSSWQVIQVKPLAGGAAGTSATLVPGSASEIWVAGTQGVLMRRSGTDWLTEPTLTLQPYQSISAASSSDIVVVGANGLILHRY